ncbi:MAG: TIGR03790 family protein [Verrucomicrobiaceae bacterium]
MIRSLIFLIFASSVFANPAPLLPGHVGIVYNSSSPESKDLAEFYALNRMIPPENLIGIPMPMEETIGRDEFNRSIRDPLRAEFKKRNWWTMGNDQNGNPVPIRSVVRCLALMRGVPLRINRIETPASEATSQAPFKPNNEAAVDSELALLGVPNLPIGGPLNNNYYQKDIPFIQLPQQYQLLVGRIDAKDTTTCKRMILDAIDVEKEGLWGRTYIDFARKGGAFSVGDEWLEAITKRSMTAGFPVVTERSKDTFVSHYPMGDAAVYFGWYTFHRNGPFLDPGMKFRKGAVAVHLHSLSAGQMRDPSVNWSAALLDRGAAATLGNTWEPYLQVSHNFDIFHDRLMKGYSIVESAGMAMNALSWQNIVIGDPLYRPFKVLTERPSDLTSSRDYKALRLAHTQWPDPAELTTKLRGAAARMKSGIIYEAVGFGLLESGQYAEASAFFESAKTNYPSRFDQLRQTLNQVEVDRRRGETVKAISQLQVAKARYKDLPQVKAVDALLVILDPPAPPPTNAKKK